MRIGIVTPAPPRSRYGNRVTALRWARILRGLGHRVRITQAYQDEPYDLLIALHARRSYPSVSRFHRACPGRPLIVALTGTDLYRDLPRSRSAQNSLGLATLLIALQPKASDELEPHLREKVRVIYQSASAPSPKRRRRKTPISRRRFNVCVIGHLRPVKDPFRAALAARRLPSSSRLRILHVGAAMDEKMADRALFEMTVNPRYQWLGEQPRWRVRQILEHSALCVLSSKLEGGANVVSEAIVAGVPLVASRIAGSVGLLGESYHAYFKVGDTEGLARLLYRAETDRAFLTRLNSHCARLAPLFDPRRERSTWSRLLAELNLLRQATG
ncbi:MAG: selenoneine biosynthesis selenosugar synthase SenB [Bryobacteraceae bacterium]